MPLVLHFIICILIIGKITDLLYNEPLITMITFILIRTFYLQLVETQLKLVLAVE
jgi:hypothetical protein